MSKILGDNYELYVLTKLKEEYDDVWLWKNIPEKLLFEHNIIMDYYTYSESRKDIGIDIVGLKNNKLHFYQCKNHSETVTLDKIAGMLLFCLSRSVDVNLCYSNNISSYVLKTINQWKDKMILKINLIHIPYINISSEIKHIDNVAMKPRQYQLDAINTLTNFNRGLLSSPCGTGKTYISSMISHKYKNIIIFAPLKELTSSLLNTYYNLSEKSGKILISSDSAGCRDIKKIKDKLQKTNIIASTYDSSDIVFNLINILPDLLIIIDEFHNLSKSNIEDNNNYMNKILMSNAKILFVSATPTNKISFDKTYKMSWNYAIKNGLICDFNMMVPDKSLMIDDKFSKIIGELKDISEDKKTLINQAYFLIRSMLYNGNRKCIAFFTKIEKVEIFSKIVHCIAELCNICVDTFIIVNCIRSKERKKRIDDFKLTNNIAIILSVHIMDEGIDIPNCDSVFISKPDHDINNLIQRVSRCNRVIPGKNKANMYLWCSSSKLKTILKDINKKFMCEIPDNISILDVISNRVIQKPLDTHNKNILKCKICEKIFNSLVNLEDHKCLEKKTNNNIKCDICCETFLNDDSFKTHTFKCKNKVHTDDNKNNEVSILKQEINNLKRMICQLKGIDGDNEQHNIKDYLNKHEKINSDFMKDFYNIVREDYFDRYYDFLIDSEILRKWLKISMRKKFSSNIKKNYKQDVDFKIEKVTKVKGSGGHNREIIILTPETAKKICLLTKSKIGDSIRQYFIDIELASHKFKDYVIESLNKKIRKLENK